MAQPWVSKTLEWVFSKCSLIKNAILTVIFHLFSESDGDYNPNLLSALTIQLNADTPPTGACFEVPISTDSTVETDEMFTMSINSNTQVEFSATNGEATVTIVNDDGNGSTPINYNSINLVDVNVFILPVLLFKRIILIIIAIANF